MSGGRDGGREGEKRRERRSERGVLERKDRVNNVAHTPRCVSLVFCLSNKLL